MNNNNIINNNINNKTNIGPIDLYCIDTKPLRYFSKYFPSCPTEEKSFVGFE